LAGRTAISQGAILHIKLDPEMDEQLAKLARARKSCKDRLVRDEIIVCYKHQ